MSAMVSIWGAPSPWQSWSLGSEDFGYSATGAGASVPSPSTPPGWIVATMLATLATTAGMTPTMAIKSLVGTGGSLDSLVSEDRTDAVAAESWEGLFERIGTQAKAEAADVLAGADLIAEIKATLGVSITDLASIAGVSRQAVYDWIGGGAISKDNYDRLFALRQVCGQWRALAEKPVGRLIHGKGENGMSLFDLLEREALDEGAIRAQLEALAARLAQRTAERVGRQEKLQPLDEKAHRENLLIHVPQVTDA